MEQKWRSIDHVPEEYESVPVLISHEGHTQIGFMTTSYEWCMDGRVLKIKPTHWQPLPTPALLSSRAGEKETK